LSHTGIIFGYFVTGSSILSSAVDFIFFHEESNIYNKLSLLVSVVLNDFLISGLRKQFINEDFSWIKDSL
jgi:hypothetical protein